MNGTAVIPIDTKKSADERLTTGIQLNSAISNPDVLRYEYVPSVAKDAAVPKQEKSRITWTEEILVIILNFVAPN